MAGREVVKCWEDKYIIGVILFMELADDKIK